MDAAEAAAPMEILIADGVKDSVILPKPLAPANVVMIGSLLAGVEVSGN